MSKILIDSSGMLSSIMGKQMYLPKYIAYHGTVILLVSIMVSYYFVTSWNEKTGVLI